MVSARSLGVQQGAFDQWMAGWAHRTLQPAEGEVAGPAPGVAQLAEGIGQLHARIVSAVEALRGGALPDGWGPADRARVDFVVHLLSRYGHSLHLFRRHLEGWTEVLVGTGRAGGALAAAVIGAGRARQAMEREVQDLRPFAHWPPELEERWAGAAAEARRTASARWGAWGVRAGTDGAPPELVLVLPGAPALSLADARADAEGVAARLEAVAGDALPPLPPLRDALDRDRWLGPGHRGDPVAVVQERQSRWTATHAAPREFALLGGRAADPASPDGADADPRVDPHRASVVRVVEPCALPATGTWLDAEARMGGGPAGGLPLLDPVERRAAACEERFPRHGLTRPVFSPAVRVYFAAPQRLRDLLLAVAFGCVRPRLGRREHALFLGNDALTGERGAGEPLLLEALDSYVLAGCTAEPRRPLDTDAVHAQVQAALAALDADGARAFPGQAEAAVRALAAGCPPPVSDQLAALARFFATVSD
jgi:hypothetical protein